jgi:hypothetical protein
VAIQIATFAIDDTEGTYFDIQSVEVSAVPEPSTYALLSGLAVLGLILIRRRMRS